MDTVVLVYCLNDIAAISLDWQETLNRIYKENDPKSFLFEKSFFLNQMYFRYKAATDPNVKNYYKFTLKSYRSKTWNYQRGLLDSLGEIVRRKGGELLVVTFPYLHSLGPRYPARDIHKKLNIFWRDNNIPHLDLLKSFRDYKPETLTVSPYDAHPNEFAHKLAASVMLNFIDKTLEEN